ncbi:MAG TPA: hypothetical protein ENI62_04380 [Gammaproteobacteria bacterium]|nr:hypothetical protein [Gammaproteobacteria bacterium]
MKIMKIRLFVVTVSLALITACAGPAGLQQADDYYAGKDYLKAAQAYQQLLTLSDLGMDLRARIDAKLVKLKVLITEEYLVSTQQQRQAQPYTTVPTYEGAIKNLENVILWDDGQARLAKQIAILKEQAQQLSDKAAEYYRTALQASRSFHFTEALDALNRAIALNPQSKYLMTGRKIEKQHKLFNKVADSLAKRSLTQALKQFDILSATYPKPLDLAQTSLLEQVVSLIVEKSRTMTTAGQWLQALDYLQSWHMPTLATRIKLVYQEGAQHYVDVAKDALKNGYPHKAYLYTLRAAELDPRNPEVFDLSKRAGDKVDESIQSYIAVASFDSPSNEPDAGRQFSDSLISYLYSILPYGINILERDKIDYLLKENRERIGALGKILGADLVVTGTVSLFKVDSSIDKRTATVKIQVGEETVENPEFTQMVRLYGVDTTHWPDIPPRTIKKGNIQLLKYTKGTGQKKGFAKVSIRIFDTEKGTISFVKDYNADLSKVARFQDEVADAGIKYIPLNLPTDTEILEEMRKGIIKEIAKVVQASFGKRETRFLNQVQFYLGRREYEAALQPLAKGHFYCQKSNIEKSVAACKEISRLITKQVQ